MPKVDWYKCVNTTDTCECAEQGWVFHGNNPIIQNKVKRTCPCSNNGLHEWRKIPGNQNVELEAVMYPEDKWNIEK